MEPNNIDYVYWNVYIPHEQNSNHMLSWLKYFQWT